MPDEWIVIPNWDKHQHYSDRDPRWIKDHLSQHDDDDYYNLTFAERGLLKDLRLAYAASDGKCPLNTLKLSRRFGQKVTRRQLDALNHAGLIAFVASKPLALARSREKRREEKRDALARKDENQAKRARNWIRNGATADVPLERLGDVIAEEFKITDDNLLADLVAQAQETRP